MIFMTEITFGCNFFIGGKSAELNPFSTVSQVINKQAILKYWFFSIDGTGALHGGPKYHFLTAVAKAAA
jgi:hypothetical protein